MSVKIIVDSTVDLTPEVKAQVTAVPLCVRFGDAEYQDGVTITPEKFYEMLVASEELPTTSQPTPALFEDAFREARHSLHTGVIIPNDRAEHGLCSQSRHGHHLREMLVLKCRSVKPRRIQRGVSVCVLILSDHLLPAAGVSGERKTCQRRIRRDKAGACQRGDRGYKTRRVTAGICNAL